MRPASGRCSSAITHEPISVTSMLAPSSAAIMISASVIQTWLSSRSKDVDARHEAGHDEKELAAIGSFLSPRSDLPPLDLVDQRLDHVGDVFEVRIEGERLAVGRKRILIVADLLEHHAEPGQRTEMARLARQHLADVGNGAGKIVIEVMDGGAPIPGLDVVRLDLDDRIEKF